MKAKELQEEVYLLTVYSLRASNYLTASLELPTEQGLALGIHGPKLKQPGAHVCTASPVLPCERKNKYAGKDSSSSTKKSQDTTLILH